MKFSFIIIILFPFITKAQTLSYQELDSLCTIINDIQANTIGKFKNEDIEYEYSFPKENFRVYSYNHKATKAFYSRKNDEEVMIFTPDVDLTEANGMTLHQRATNLSVLKVHFPKGFIKQQIVSNNKSVNNETENFLEFVSKDSEFRTLVVTTFRLISELKINKGLFTSSQLEQELYDFYKISDKAFLAKHPSSLFIKQSKILIEEKEERERIEEEQKEISLKKFNDYVNRLLKKMNYVPNKTFEELVAINPEITRQGITKKRFKADNLGNKELYFYNHGKYKNGNFHMLPEGSISNITIDQKTNMVKYFYYVLKSSTDFEYIKNQFSILANEIKENVSDKYIDEKKDEEIKIGNYRIGWIITLRIRKVLDNEFELNLEYFGF